MALMIDPGEGQALMSLGVKMAAGDRKTLAKRQARAGVFFVLPALLYFAVWMFGPIIYGIWLGFTDTSFLGSSKFTGLDNYRTLFSDPSFIHSAVVTAEYLVYTTVPVMLVAFISAYALHHARGRISHALYLTVIFLPFVLPSVAAAIIFELILQPGGLFNDVTRTTVAWLTDPSTAVISLSIATAWGLVGYYVVIFLAGFQSVPKQLIEAASIDGSSKLSTLFRIELPLLRPVILFSTVTVVATVLTNFATPFVMTNGGPGDATTVLPLLIYKTAFQYSNPGYASAMAVVLFIVSVVLTVIQFALIRTRGEKS